jgi:hypothetical protein
MDLDDTNLIVEGPALIAEALEHRCPHLVVPDVLFLDGHALFV